MKDKWTMEIDQRGLYNGESLHKWGIGKNIKEKIRKRFTVALERT